jgi:TRAP-type C4-dicarboxylate transport system permease small subunit
MIRRLHSALDALVLGVTMPLTVVMLVCVVWQVIGRYLLGISTSYTDEMARFLFIWVSLLGAAYVLGRRGHIAITGLINFAPARPRRVIDLLIFVLVMLFAAVILCVGGGVLVERALRLGQVSPAMLLPVGYVYAVIPISGVLTAIYGLLGAAELLTGQESAHSTVSLD